MLTLYNFWARIKIVVVVVVVVGREQVSVGVVPMMKAAGKGLSGAQSALSVYPIAIANCAEKR